MDQIFVELIDDQARFLKATFAIPAVRHLPVEDIPKQIIQIGPLHSEIREQLDKEKNWIVRQYDGCSTNLCDKIEQDIEENPSSRSLIYINDISRLELCQDPLKARVELIRLLNMIDKWKRSFNNFVVILYQNSNTDTQSELMRDLLQISDAMIKSTALKDHYFQHIWYQPMPTHKTLIPPKIVTLYYTCKVGKSYWTSDLLCFFDRVQVSKIHDLNQSKISITKESDSDEQDNQGDNEGDAIRQERLLLDDDDNVKADHTTTLPYIRAQNPEQSRIFYYPDKDDDIDEDDPDNDLNI